jgi:cell division transport system ATP-binding protein
MTNKIENTGDITTSRKIKEEIKAEELEKKESKIIEFENVSKVFKDDFLALSEITFSIKRGEFVSLVGPSGAGKSTIIKLISAEEIPTSGNIFFDGNPLSQISRRKLPLYRRNMGTVFQDFKLLGKKTVFENVAYALEVCGVSASEIEENVPQILDIVGLGDKMEKFPKHLSGGEQQKVALARALIHKPKVILADEPTGNLDPASSVEIVELLLKINELGTTIILASHDKEIVNKASRRVIFLDEGKIIGDLAKSKYKM